MSITVVAAIIQDENGQYLASKRASHKQAAGKWEFPGGKPEENEALEEALVREIYEELGVPVKILRQFDRTTTGEIDLVCFAAELTGEKPTTSTDHSELRWVPEAELSGLDWAEPDLPALKKLLMPYC